MIASELLQQAYTAFRGKIAAKTPAWGTDKANVVLEIANRKIGDWARDPDQVWASLFRSDITAVNQPGTVTTAGTTTLTGSGTYFTDFKAGDTILVSGETVRTISAIASNTSLTVTSAFSTSAGSLTFSHRSIIATAIQEYSLHRSLYIPSDKLTISTTSQNIYFCLVRPQERNYGKVYLSGNNPKKITFYDTIASTSQVVGGTLLMPGYYLPSSLTLETDIIPVDDPEWLVLITASELARNDSAKSDQFPNLVAMANERYAKMISANISIGFGNGGTVPNLMPRIGDYSEDQVAAFNE